MSGLTTPATFSDPTADSAQPGSETFYRLRNAGAEVVVHAGAKGSPGLARVLHWGLDLGELAAGELADISTASIAQVTSYVPDHSVPLAILPEHAAAYFGWPGVSGCREDGSGWSPYFTLADSDLFDRDGDQVLRLSYQDGSAELALLLELEMLVSGLLRLRATLRNTSPTAEYRLDAVTLALPVPPAASELLDFTGRHTRERAPQRQSFNVGTWLRESRRGHGGHDASLLMVAGTSGFSFGSGEVWGLHVAWSGNQRILAERMPTGGHALLGGGELLLPGEVRLQPGEDYAAPWIYASHSAAGLDGMARRFHDYIRSRPQHPRSTRPRPVIVNTWEAVYFDVDPLKLEQLATAAAAVGAERFVLDDGWFLGRRGESRGLGDWYVDPDVWPDGLTPLIKHVHGLGMEFGLWVEPEGINPDSRVAREHPDWILGTGGRPAPESRLQQVIDLSHPEAFAYILERLDALLTENDVNFLKWDMNRDITDGGSAPLGRPAIHRNAAALYRLLDALKARHPAVEIESCAGGGGRVDLGILERTDRIWASDTNDPLERQRIQRWTSLLLPPELVGAHVGSAHAHTTHRTHTIAFSAGTALFGHFGIELDLTTVPPEQLAELKEWVQLYKDFRPLIHSGVTVHGDHPDPAIWVHGVVAPDGSEGLFAIVGMKTGVTQPPGLIRFPGLPADRTYRVRLQAPAHLPTHTRVVAPWTGVAAPGGPGLTLSGATLGQVGVQAPFLFPASLVLVHVSDVNLEPAP